MAYNAVSFVRESSSCSPVVPQVQAGLHSVVMKPGEGLGIHSWDIRIYTKGYFQVCDLKIPQSHG